MTSHRGVPVFLLCTFCVLAILLPQISLAAIGGVGSAVTPANEGDSANKICKNPNRVYTLACDLKEKDKDGKETGKLGGLNCNCEVTITSEKIIGKCVAYDVCRAQTISSSPGGSGSDTDPTPLPDVDSSETGPGAYVTPVVDRGTSPITLPPEPSVGPGASAYSPGSGISTYPVIETSGSAYGGYSGLPPSAPIGEIGSIAQPSIAPDLHTPNVMQNNWSSPSDFSISRLGETFRLGQSLEPFTNYYIPTYRPAWQSGSSTSQQVTFHTDSRGSFYSPDSPSEGFFAILYGAGNAVLSGLSNVFTSLNGISGSGSSSGSDSEETLQDILNERIGAQANAEDAGPVSESERRANVETAVSAAKSVRTSLQELNQTIQKPYSTSTPVKTGSTTATYDSAVPEEAKAELIYAEVRVEALEKELTAGRETISASNARIRELTNELNALNDRIRTVTREISDPTLTESERASLLGALIDNIQLALSDAETRLEKAIADNPPPTVGQKMFRTMGSVFSGFFDWTISISIAFSGFIQSIWRSIFPAF